jgi:putative RecB family exonuclease
MTARNNPIDHRFRLMAIALPEAYSATREHYEIATSRLCAWCAHQKYRPVFGGAPRPYPGWPDYTRAEGVPCPTQPAP